MTGASMLAHQLRVLHVVAARNVEGMSQVDSLAQPTGGGNCANWILGHLVNVHNELARVLGIAPVWESPELERAGPEPITSAEGAIPWNTLVDRFAASEDRFAEALDALTDEQLAEVIPSDAFGDTPRGILLATVLFHQAYHAGQLATARRAAGREGAIKIPGTE